MTKLTLVLIYVLILIPFLIYNLYGIGKIRSMRMPGDKSAIASIIYLTFIFSIIIYTLLKLMS